MEREQVQVTSPHATRHIIEVAGEELPFVLGVPKSWKRCSRSLSQVTSCVCRGSVLVSARVQATQRGTPTCKMPRILAQGQSFIAPSTLLASGI